MPVEIEPPALARLVDFAERPRAGDWSLRAGLVRYAQLEPERVNRVLELVRRVDAALHAHAKVIQHDGHDLWAALQDSAGRSSDARAEVVDLLGATAQLDQLGDIVAAWAVDRSGRSPGAQVDAITADVEQRLDALGVPREERSRPPRRPSAG